MMHLDDAIQFLLGLAKGHHRPSGYEKYGYDIYLTDAMVIYWRDIAQVPGNFKSQEAQDLEGIFYDAAWQLCRMGILRPSVRHILDPGEKGASFIPSEK